MAMDLVNLADGSSIYTSGVDEARFIYKEIYEDHCYDGLELLEAPFIVDAVANIGLFSIYMKHKYPSSRILAFEPAPRNLDALHRNLELHNALDGVEMHICGLDSEPGEARLMYYPNLPGNLMLMPEEKADLQEAFAGWFSQEAADQKIGDAEVSTVTLQRLSHFLDSHAAGKPGNGGGGIVVDRVGRVDLLQKDVEGAELQVLRGLDERHCYLVRNVVLESSDSSGARGEIEGMLRTKGFAVSREAAWWAS